MTKLFAAIFFVLLVMGLPIWLVLGVSAGTMFGIEGKPLSFAQKILDELNSTTLLAVPFFVIAAPSWSAAASPAP